MHEKLKRTRVLKGYSQEKFSKVIAMDQTTYSRKERGKSSITEEEWDRFAKALDVPKQEIKVILEPQATNENCNFNDQHIAIQYITIPQEVLDTVLKFNKKLEEDNLFQKQEINSLKDQLRHNEQK
jgi:transcriptional regulator with XRE-family HTH domain